MGNWRWGLGVVLVVVAVIYVRSVTIRTEKIQDERRRGRVRMMLLGLPLGVIIWLFYYMGRDLLLWFHLTSQ